MPNNSTAKKIKKGCGELFENCESSGCGKEDFDEDHPEIKYPIELCPTCQARLSQYKSDLQQELEFLEEGIMMTYEIKNIFFKETIQERINFIKKELEELK